MKKKKRKIDVDSSNISLYSILWVQSQKKKKVAMINDPVSEGVYADCRYLKSRIGLFSVL